MNLPRWREEPIGKHHKRALFDCGQQDLNEFLAKYARQAHESSASKTYVAVDTHDAATVLGFYTLCPAQIQFTDAPHAVRSSSAGKHPLGCFRLAKLAISKTMQGQGLGGQLLAAAIRRCLLVSAQVGGSFLLIDAKDAKAVMWYKSYGAMEIPGKPLCLVLPYAPISSVFCSHRPPPIQDMDAFKECK